MIERHYGALLQASGEAIRGKLDAYHGSFGPRVGHGRDAELTPRSDETPASAGVSWDGRVLGSNQ